MFSISLTLLVLCHGYSLSNPIYSTVSTLSGTLFSKASLFIFDYF